MARRAGSELNGWAAVLWATACAENSSRRSPMATTLQGSTALVTGATAGIGRAVALQLAALGAEVVVHGRSAERGAKTVQEIQNAGGKARFVAADLSNPDDTRRLATEAGGGDILGNKAGGYQFGTTAATDNAVVD